MLIKYEIFKCCGCIEEADVRHDHIQQVEIVGTSDSFNSELGIEQNSFNIV